MSPARLSRLLLPLLLAIPASGQGLDSTVKQLAQDAAGSYVAPIVSGFGAALNAGWFHRAPPAKKFSLGFEGGIVAMGSLFTGAPEHFQIRSEFRFDSAQASLLIDSAFKELDKDPRAFLITPQQKRQVRDTLVSRVSALDFKVGISGATVIGSPKDSIRVAFAGDSMRVHVPPSALAPNGFDTTLGFSPQDIALRVPVGQLQDLPALPLVAPQITVGTVLGTQATFRLLPRLQMISELGDITYFGFGIQHNPAAWLPVKMPVDFSGGFFTQRLTVGDVFTARTLAAGLTVSKTLGWRPLNIIPYAGFMWEKSTMNVKYDYTLDLPGGPVTEHIDFELEGKNKTRLTTGLSLRLLIFNLNADYNWGRYRSVSAGLMVGI